MQNTIDLRLRYWRATRERATRRSRVFVLSLAVCTVAALAFASWLPLQVSIVTVFLFAGPHNWFELKYFLTRLPLRFGKSRNFFLTGFAGVGVLTSIYISLPLLFRLGTWSEEAWSIIIAGWNTLLLGWVGALVWLRMRQKRNTDWTWVFPLLLGIAGVNWLAPMFFSLAIVYVHPLIALWFLDRHLARNRPNWLATYRRFLCLLPVLLGLMIWRLSQTTPLADDNGLFWRITQHSGAELLPNVSSHLLVSVHLFLEMLHYAVWLVALPLIVPAVTRRSSPAKAWQLNSVPLARHPRGFPRLIATMLLVGAVMVVVLWAAFGIDYAATRDIYFTVAIAHVLGEAPFLLRML